MNIRPVMVGCHTYVIMKASFAYPLDWGRKKLLKYVISTDLRLLQ